MRVALITGASGGLGQYIARGLAREDYCLILHYNSNPSAVESLSRDLKVDSISIKADITKTEEVISMAEKIKRTFQRLDLLVNNAAITVDRLLLRLDERQWDRVIKVNLTGPFLVIKHCLEMMPEGSHIINIISRSGIKGRAGQAAYAASKAALVGLTKTLARELAPRGIKVNAIMPGYLPVGMGPRAEKAMKKALEDSPLGTLCKPEDIISLIIALTKTTSLTGQVISADSRL